MTPPVNLDDKRVILSALHRYPNGGVYLDLRIWGVRIRDNGDTELVPTRKGIAIEFNEALPDVLKKVRALRIKWGKRLSEDGGNQ